MVTSTLDALIIVLDSVSPYLFTFIVSAVSIWIALLTRETAQRRGRSAKLWLGLGIIFGPFAWLAVALLPRKQRTA
jgi:hypothetical protein